MSMPSLSVRIFGSVAALACAASCTPVSRQFGGTGGAGGAGGASTTTAGGLPATTGADMPASGSGVTASGSGAASTSSGGCGDTQNDPLNCGSCGVQCALSQTCAADACTDNFTTCAGAGSCADPACQTDMRFSVDAFVAADLTAARRLWQRSTKGPLDYLTAGSYCGTLTLDGVNSGWRLPTGAELGSILVHPGGLMGCSAPYCSPATDQATFAGTVVDEYWTSDPYMSDSHYCVSFCDGRKTPYKELDTSPHYVRCVHDPLP